jgi:hypothetical protein
MLKRSDKVAFIGVADEKGTVTYHRMRNFTEFSQSKNAIEYSRQYVDEAFERSDVVGYSPSISYSFDADSSNKGQKSIIDITDGEKLGDEAIVSILVVDMTKSTEDTNAVCREFTVIPDSEGDDTNAYTYSGSLKANGSSVSGKATSTDNFSTVTFTESK